MAKEEIGAVTTPLFIAALALGCLVGIAVIAWLGYQMTKPRTFVYDEPMPWQEAEYHTRISADFMEKE